VDLALVGGAIAEVAERDVVVAAVLLCERKPRAERNVSADDPMSAVEVLLHGEHVHRAALALGVAAAAARELGHHALGIHAASQHVAVVAGGGVHLITFLRAHLQTDDDALLTDVEMAEAADEAHAVELAGLLFEPADEQHLAIGVQLLLSGELHIILAAARELGYA